MESPAERDLIARMTRQEPEALRDFQAAYTHLLRYIIAPLLPDPRDQEECLADAIHRAWERIGQFDRTGGSFSGWLSVLARNTALNHLRSQNRRPQWESLDGRGQLIDPAPTPEQALLQKERLQACLLYTSRPHSGLLLRPVPLPPCAAAGPGDERQGGRHHSGHLPEGARRRVP